MLLPSLAGLEPDDNCPVHGTSYPPRCGEGGKFLSHKQEGFATVFVPLGYRNSKGESCWMHNGESFKSLDDFYEKHPELAGPFLLKD
jgi:hypothetical protein